VYCVRLMYEVWMFIEPVAQLQHGAAASVRL